jgi:hypothetical protein
LKNILVCTLIKKIIEQTLRVIANIVFKIFWKDHKNNFLSVKLFFFWYTCEAYLKKNRRKMNFLEEILFNPGIT